jgi:translation initiation factor 2B subunit (eIF-2B alpha/beta/delta family)
MADIKDRAREYIAEHSEYKEVLGETFVAVDTLNAMVGFAEQETKALKEYNKELEQEKAELKETIRLMNELVLFFQKIEERKSG